MRIDRFTILARCSVTALLLVAIAGCGGGGLARVVTARVIPATVTLSPGVSTSVELEVSCYSDGSTATFKGFIVNYRLDPSVSVPAGISATFAGSADSRGFYTGACDTATTDPNHWIARIPIVIAVAAGLPSQSALLRVLVEGEGDGTSADLTVRVTGAAATPG